MVKRAVKEYFSERETALRLEATKHPELINKIEQAGTTDMAEALGHIAAYCDVIVDGDYTQSDLEGLYDILVSKLIEKRTSIIIH